MEGDSLGVLKKEVGRVSFKGKSDCMHSIRLVVKHHHRSSQVEDCGSDIVTWLVLQTVFTHNSVEVCISRHMSWTVHYG